MKVVFFASDKPREIMLAEALRSGVKTLGDDFEIRRTADYGDDCKYEGPTPDTHVACTFGVKGKSKAILEDHRSVGRATLYLDKGYVRDKGEGGHTLYTRVAVNAFHPTAYFNRIKRGPERFDSLSIKIRAKGPKPGGHVLFCGSSQKYCDFHGLGDATQYASKVLARIRKVTLKQLVYRPKPSWHEAVPIGGAAFSTGTSSIEDAMRGCHVMVTHGSNAALDAVLFGVPVIALDPDSPYALIAAAPDIDAIEDAVSPSWDARYSWVQQLAWCQWTNAELASGEAWKALKEEIEAAR